VNQDGRQKTGYSGLFSITSATSQPSITVISPNGGEKWYTKTTQTVKWTASNLSGYAYIYIDQDIDGDGSYEKANYITSALVSAGQKSFTLPSTIVASPKNKVRILGGSYPYTQDSSDAPFSIVASITVVSPNGGETLQEGSEYTIKWSASNLPDDAKIYITLFRSDEANMSIVSNLPATQREYVWKVTTIGDWGYGYEYKPSLFAKILGIKEVKAAGYSYQIMVSASWGTYGTNYYGNVYDRSDGWFDINPLTPSITVISPNGGEKFTIGSPMTIKWQNTNYRDSVVNISLYKSSTIPGNLDYNFVARIGNLAQPNDEIEVWTIPSTIAVGENYFIRVNLDVKDPESGFDMVDDSDAPFTITKNLICEDINNVSYSGFISTGGGIWPGYNWGYSYGTYYEGSGWLDNNHKNTESYPLEIHYLGNINYGIDYGAGILTFECDGITKEAYLPDVSIPAGGSANVLYVAYDGSTYYDKNLTNPARTAGTTGLLKMENQLASISGAINQLMERLKALIGR
jgi:hypothetical protein